jgi:hypothetical protein
MGEGGSAERMAGDPSKPFVLVEHLLKSEHEISDASRYNGEHVKHGREIARRARNAHRRRP